jgi:hypothetical protein
LTYIYIKENNLKRIQKTMKNLLSENMLRFGTKNLTESSKQRLTLESIMQTIYENGLTHAVRNRLLTEDKSLDPSVLTNIQAQVTKFNTALKAAYPKCPAYLEAYEGTQPQRSGGDETYSIYIVAKSTALKGEVEVGRFSATQDLNGVIFNKQITVAPGAGLSNQKKGQQYANDPAMTTKPTAESIGATLSKLATSGNVDSAGEFNEFLRGNGQSFIIRALMDAFNAVQVYPTSTRENKNTSAGRQTQTGGAAKGTNPYKKG